ncbi:hypothetical protein [Synechococcus sp. UW140]|uniref:hypothetical protein n=1 Tax=Synechococcus sp. UW140 TaxID=368503 RepID=UPI000E0E3E22|nr:hypothetical protein [Synechococcus sp. UW140]
MTNNNPELNLSDPSTVEALINADAVKPPSAPAQEIESKIKQAQKSATFSMKLSADAIETLKRLAASRRIDWKEYLRNEVESKIVNQKIGMPSIDTPSIGLEPTNKIVGPSAKTRIRRIG